MGENMRLRVYLCVIKVSRSAADKVAQKAEDAAPQGEPKRAASSNWTHILLSFSWKVPQI